MENPCHETERMMLEERITFLINQQIYPEKHFKGTSTGISISMT
jgi:hypothetical protein